MTKDGPYRITGGISLAGADGEPSHGPQGASLEHYALCRCGQSQNKPFCSGMHWYVGFRDPVPAAGYEPTLFEWAGGLPALTRMSRLLYEKHVPPTRCWRRYSPTCRPISRSGWPPGWPGRSAGRLRRRAASSGRRSSARPPAGSTEEQRARWAALAGTAADQAGLPADPAFRSAFSACVEWASRTALEQPRPPPSASRCRRRAGDGARAGRPPPVTRTRQRTRRASPRTCRDRTSR